MSVPQRYGGAGTALKAAIVGAVAGCFFLLVCTGQSQSLRPALSGRLATSNSATKPQWPTSQAFQQVMDHYCLRCHSNQVKNLDTLVKVRWLAPGKPEASPVYKVIGVHKNPKGTYHNMPTADKQVVFDFIKNMQK